jgi:hypothetical protein
LKNIIFCVLAIAGLLGSQSADARKPSSAGIVLKIKTEIGMVSFQNTKSCTETECGIYKQLPFAHTGFALVQAVDDSGLRYLLINKQTSIITNIYAEPSLSPDKSYLVTSNFDEMGDADESKGTFVWAISEFGTVSLLANIPYTEFADTKVISWQESSCVSVTGLKGWGSGAQMEIATAAIQISNDKKSASLAKSC